MHDKSVDLRVFSVHKANAGDDIDDEDDDDKYDGHKSGLANNRQQLAPVSELVDGNRWQLRARLIY